MFFIKDAWEQIKSLDRRSDMTEKVANALKLLWTSRLAQEFNERNEDLRFSNLQSTK